MEALLALRAYFPLAGFENYGFSEIARLFHVAAILCGRPSVVVQENNTDDVSPQRAPTVLNDRFRSDQIFVLHRIAP